MKNWLLFVVVLLFCVGCGTGVGDPPPPVPEAIVEIEVADEIDYTGETE